MKLHFSFGIKKEALAVSLQFSYDILQYRAQGFGCVGLFKENEMNNILLIWDRKINQSGNIIHDLFLPTIGDSRTVYFDE